ncbi:MAG: FtsW/RodA/SpoVE family cell cycle protein, partial [Elusimicrobiota bacterium]|nr:FtsW/RodA/SpoVE family cell cycle protein [Elusimicrobiota bacterium]
MKNKIERIIVFAVVLLSVISIVMVTSATVESPGFSGFYLKQAAAVLIGMVLMWGIRNISYELFLELSPVFYLTALAMLVFVLIFGTEVYGSRRWFDLGLFNFQPSEFAKLASILFGVYLVKKKQTLFKAALVFILPAALILIQPDAGTALMFLPAYLGIILVSGRDIRWV